MSQTPTTATRSNGHAEPATRVADKLAAPTTMPSSIAELLQHATAGKTSVKPEKGVSVQLPGVDPSCEPEHVVASIERQESVGVKWRVPMPAGNLDRNFVTPGKAAASYVASTYKAAMGTK